MNLSNYTPETRNKIIGASLLFLITVCIFHYTLGIRQPWFGKISSGRHQWLTGSTLIFSSNWYREGALNMKFELLQQPRSVETPSIESRSPYTSYPPGAVLPTYILSKLRGHEPTPSLVMAYNLLNHFLIALFLSLAVFFFLLQLRFSYLDSFVMALIPLLMELLLPGPLYWHQNVFFSDQAVILPFALFIFLEVIREDVKTQRLSRTINFIQAIILFYGFLTDWLFAFVAFAVYAKRVIIGEIRLGKGSLSFIADSFRYWFPPMLAIALFALQIYLLNGLSSLINIFVFRTGLNAEGHKYTANFFENFWISKFGLDYGKIAIWFVWGSLLIFVTAFLYVAYRYFKKQEIGGNIKKTLSLIGVLLVPCFMQIYVLKNHSAIHDFSTLKFSIPLATVPFVLIPILAASFLKVDFSVLSLEGLKLAYKDKRIDIRMSLITLVLLILAIVYLSKEHPHFSRAFPSLDEMPAAQQDRAIGNSIRRNTTYNDVLFSPDFEIPVTPPQQLAYSMKRVYKIKSLKDIKPVIANIKGSYQVIVLFKSPPDKKWHGELGDVPEAKSDVLHYYVVPSEKLTVALKSNSHF